MSPIIVRKKGENIELDKKSKDSIQYFLEHAFDNNPNKSFKFGGFFSAKTAQREISKCTKRFSIK
jgi:inorganic pyrophosphatase